MVRCATLQTFDGLRCRSAWTMMRKNGGGRGAGGNGKDRADDEGAIAFALLRRFAIATGIATRLSCSAQAER